MRGLYYIFPISDNVTHLKFAMTIPDDILAANAAGRIPSGVSLEYLAGSRDKSAIAGIIFMVCFTGLLMIVRLFARAFIVKKIGLDDALAVVTLVRSSTFHPRFCTALNVHGHHNAKLVTDSYKNT